MTEICPCLLKVRIKELSLHHYKSEGVDHHLQGQNAVTFEVPQNAGVVWKMLCGLNELFHVAAKTSIDAEIKNLEAGKGLQASKMRIMRKRGGSGYGLSRQ